MPFEKGQSGNPAGRPRGSRGRATMALQDMLERDAESIARTAINLAKVVDVHVQALATAAFEARLARLEQARAH